MKRILILLLTIAAAGIQAQSWEYNKADAKLFYFWQGTDTLVNADTLSREYPEVLNNQFYVYGSFTADSLTGGPAGRAYLQGSYKYEPETWFNLDTLTFNGAGTYSTTYLNSAYLPLKLRLYAISSGTCTIRLTEGWLLLKRN